MLQILQQIVVIILLGCLFVALLYFGAILFVAALVVGALATLYFSIRFYFLRRKLKGALAEYHDTRFSDAYTDTTQGESVHDMSVIDVEYTEVEETAEPNKKDTDA